MLIDSPLSFRDTAERIGARLCRDALWHGRRCNWIGASMEAVDGQLQIVQRSFGGDLYSGTSGIALFLTRLYRVAPDPLVARTVEGALRQAMAGTDELPADSRLGFYTGGVGIAYAAAQWAEVSGDGRWAETALDLLRRLATEDREGHVLDVVAGTAGAVAPLLELGCRLDAPDLIDLAIVFGDELLAAAHRREHGWSWDTRAAPGTRWRDHLLGLSHGVSGIAWALLELYAISGESRFRRGAEQAMRYERQWYDPHRGNWPDLRLNGRCDEPLSFPVQWCHGAPGIGLVRLRAFELLGDSVYRREAEIALHTTLPTLQMHPNASSDATANDSLCHGRAGNAELFLEASRPLGEPHYRVIAEAVGRWGIASYEAEGLPWSSGVPGGAPTPGLMLGLAGTGYFLLRLADPRATPSILLAKPRAVATAVQSIAA